MYPIENDLPWLFTKIINNGYPGLQTVTLKKLDFSS